MSNNYRNPEIERISSIETLMEVRFQQINRATETIADIYEAATTQISDAGVDQAVSVDKLHDLNDRINRGEL